MRVNADYEFELFHKRPAPQAINQSIEFFLFFLTDRALYTQKTYSPLYLEHVQRITGRKPVVTKQTPYDNFWGSLSDLPHEKWWNSKLTSGQLIIDRQWCMDTLILTSESDLSSIDWQKCYLLKDPSGMSGQKFLKLRPEDSTPEKLALVQKAVAQGPQILEPWFKRKYDFSQYFFPEGESISYENKVDEKFQYKGTVFKNNKQPNLRDLSFYSLLSPFTWDEFNRQIEEIKVFYSQYGNRHGFSIDSFVYLDQGELKIRTMSEINYRRTMGRVAFELAKIYAGENLWSALLLIKSYELDKPLWEILKPLKNVLVLSPGDSRFEILFLSALNQNCGVDLIEEVNKLLLNTKLSIKIE